MEASAEITLLAIVWPIIVMAVILHLLRNSRHSVGIVTVYLVTFTATYWLAPAMQMLPSYTPLQNPFFTRLGFVVSFIGLLCFLFGVLIVQYWPRRRYSFIPVTTSVAEPNNQEIHVSVPLIYYGVGVVSYFVLVPFVGQSPTLSGIVSTSAKLLFAGAILILCGRTKKSIPTWFILASVFVWPVVTILNDGFLGFGLAASMTTFICWFQITGKKLRLRHFVLAIMIAYFALSITETYFVARNEIRGLVWGGTELDARTSGVSDAFVRNFQFFGLGDAKRLSFIEGRIDLSYLTGVAIERLNSGQIEFAGGGTLAQAALMLVPRALWPNRSVAVGGNTLISQYTGIEFASGTSVATGQVMELYINFGLFGVIVGFVLLGAALAALDQRAARALREGNDFHFALYFLPALGLLLVVDTMAAVVGTTNTCVWTVLIVNFLIRLFMSPRHHVTPRIVAPQTAVLRHQRDQSRQEL